MSRKLILVRHSAVAQIPGVPSHEWKLSADGRSLSRHFALQLAPHNLNTFITSEEAKARETGEIMAGILSLPCQTAPGLQEHARQTMPYYERVADFTAAIAHFFAHPDELVLGEETAAQALHRFETAVQHILKAHPVGNLAIVTHGTVLSLFLHHHNPNLDVFEFWQKLTLPCAFVTAVPHFPLRQSLHP
jgi:broad specificity phosphatase PhoE